MFNYKIFECSSLSLIAFSRFSLYESGFYSIDECENDFRPSSELLISESGWDNFNGGIEFSDFILGLE